MSDEDYEAFLDKANHDTSGNGSGSASTTSAPKKKAGTKSVDTEVPEPLEAVEAYYTSDADEPFEPVSLQWKGDGLPSEVHQPLAEEVWRGGGPGEGETENELADLVNHRGAVSSMTREEFDPRGQYEKVIDAVKSVGTGELGFYAVDLDKTRSEYYVVILDKGKERLVGLKAVVVQS
ncbi:hypothetical protein LTS18_004323 [Coniosporium uncinatum]|uniref:Uncharacterized protein n=1 Tax=Coniosporium uncinatum TaxID=93489 RepID=A0ACC3DSW7_9PEZI|nr:hypothetical protein LTS18_004323 [Coniosporium uncinatum]